MDPLFEKNFISTKDAGDLSGYTSDYLARLARSKKVIGKKVGHSWFIEKDSLEQFLIEQRDRNTDRARTLARARGEEYRTHNSLPHRVVETLSTPVDVPFAYEIKTSLRTHALSFAVATLVVASGAYIARAAPLARLATNADTFATEVASGFAATFGDIPTRTIARIQTTKTNVAAQEARAAKNNYAITARLARALQSFGGVGSSELVAFDFSSARMMMDSNAEVGLAYGEVRLPQQTLKSDFQTSPISFDTQKIISDTYTLIASPANVGAMLAGHYRAIGEVGYRIMRGAMSLDVALINRAGDVALSFAATSRDEFFASWQNAPRLIAKMNLALGNGVINATHAAIRLDTLVAYRAAETAPRAGRAVIALIVKTGGVLAGATSHAPALATTAYLGATSAPAKLAPMIAQAIFDLEYAGATRFVAASNVASDRYLAFIQNTGNVVYGAYIVATKVKQLPLPSTTDIHNAYLGMIGNTALALDTFVRMPKVAAVLQAPPMRALQHAGAVGLAAVAPTLSVGEQLALTTYQTLNNFFTSTTSTLAAFFAPAPTIVFPSGRVVQPHLATSTRIAVNSYPTYTTEIEGVSEDFVTQSLAALRLNILGTLSNVSDRITRNAKELAGLKVTEGNFIGGSLTKGVEVSATTASFTTLLADATTLGNTTVNGNLTVSGSITPSTISAGSFIAAPYFTATTTALNTFPSLFSTNSTTTNATTTNAFIASLTNTNATSTNLYASFFVGGDATTTNLYSSSLTAGNATSTNFFANNGSVTNAAFVNATTTGSFALTSATPARLLSVSINGVATSSDLSTWLAGTTNQITLTDNGAGGLTASLPALLAITNASSTALSTNALWVGGNATTTADGNFATRGTITSGLINGQTISNAARFTGDLTIANIASTTDLYVAGSQYLSAMTPGSILFAGAGGLVAQNNSNFNWNNTANLLTILGNATTTELTTTDSTYLATTAGNVGIGLTNPQYKLEVNGTASSTSLVLGNALAVAYGGTGQTSFSSSQLLYGTGTGALQTVATSSLALGTGLNLLSGSLGYQLGGASATIKLADTAVTPATYGSSGFTVPTFTVDQQGRLTNASSYTISGLTTTNLSATANIANFQLANSTISGVALGSSLAALTATDSTLTFSGAYNGSTAQTIGLNLGNANTWTALQQFNDNASTTQFTSTGSTYLATTGGNVGIGTTNPLYKLEVNGTASSTSLVLSNALAVAYGGTGQTSFTAGNLLYGAGTDALQSIATTTPTLGLGLNYSGTLGALVGGASGSLTIATSSLYSGTTGQFPYFSGTNTLTATSSISLATNGNVGIGVTAPSYNLDVSGNGHFTSFVDATNFVATSSTATSTFAGGFTAGLCVTGDTRLRRRRKARKGEEDEADEEGYIYDEVQIKDIKEGDEIQSLDEKTGELVWSRVRQLAHMGVKDIYKITTESGKTIRTTGNHPYLARRTETKNSQPFGRENSKAIVFVDYANIKSWLVDKKLHISIKVLKQALLFAGVGNVRLYYYGTAKDNKNEGFFKALIVAGYTVITKPVQYFTIRLLELLKKPQNRRWIDALTEDVRMAIFSEADRLDKAGLSLFEPKANFDVEITADALEAVDTKTIILFSGDGDFTNLVRRLKARGQKIVVVSGRKFLSGSLMNAADKFVTMERFVEEVPSLVWEAGKAKPALAERVLKNCSSSIAALLGLSSVPPATVDNAVRPGAGSWTRAGDLKEGAEIAVAPAAGATGIVFFERVVSVEKLPAEDVYDIEVEGTHNFIGNDIVAHNTAFTVNQAAPANSLYINPSGNVGVGTASPSHALEVVTSALNNNGIIALFKTTQDDFNALQVQNSIAAWQFSVRKSTDGNAGGFNFYYSPDGSTGWVNAMNLSTGGNVSIPSGSLTVSGHTTFEGVTSTGATGTGKLVYDTSPILATPIINSAAHVGGVWAADAAWTLPAYTLGGTITGNNQSLTGLGTASTTNLISSAAPIFQSLSGILKGNGASAVSAAANGTDYTLVTAQTCTNQVITALTAAGGSTCSTVSNAMLANSTISGVSLGGSLATLTATDSTLTFSGSYDGSAARTVGLDLGNANIWTALQTFGNATTTQLTTTGSAYFATSAGNVGIGNVAPAYKLDITGAARLTSYLDASYLVATTTTATSTFAGGMTVGNNGALVVNQTAAANSLYINGNGNVGIGTTNPTGKLDVQGGLFYVKTSDWSAGVSGSGAYIGPGASTGNTYMGIQALTTGAAAVGNLVLNEIGGNVGIGNVAPAYKLDITGAARLTSYLDASYLVATTTTATSTFAGGMTVGNNGALVVNQTAAANSLYINGNGNVGIGTTNPGTALDVVGSASDGIATIRTGFTSIGDSSIGHTNSFVANTYAGADDGRLDFRMKGIAVADTKMSILGNGNVGIGTTGPVARLHIVDNTDSLAIPLLYVYQNPSTESSAITMNIRGETSATAAAIVQGGTGNILQLWQAGNVKLTVNNDGNVGIGTTTPNIVGVGGTALEISSNGDHFPSIGVSRYNGSTKINRLWQMTVNSDGGLSLRDANTGNNPFSMAASSPDSSLVINNAGNVGIGTTNPEQKLSIAGNAELTSTSNYFFANNISTISNGVDLQIVGGNSANILLTPNGSAAGTGLTVKYDGNVGIGTTNPTYQLQLSTDSAGKPGGGSWTDSSDARLKTSVATITGVDALAKIAALNPVTFSWINPSVHGGKAAPGGFIAQEMAQVFPDFVGTSACSGADCALTGGDGSTEYNLNLPFKFDAYLVAGIQALDAGLRQIQAVGGVLTVEPGTEAQCVAGDTKLRRRKKGSVQRKGNIGSGTSGAEIDDDFDQIRIIDVAVGDEIASLNEHTGRIEYRPVVALMPMGEQEVYEIVTASGRRIRTTSTHPYLVRIGQKEAQKL